MTQQHIIELCKAEIPTCTETQVRIYANMALQRFASETRILNATGTITTDGTNTNFSFPSDMIYARYIYDPNGLRAHHTSPRNFTTLPHNKVGWWVEDGVIILGYYNAETKQLVALQSGYDYELHYVKYPTALTSSNLTTELDIPLMFHEGIEARVKERLHIGNPDVQKYYHAIWKDTITEAKKYRNLNNDLGEIYVEVNEA